MKKLFFVMALAGSMIISCKKDEDPAEKFSTKSVEENKAIVEQSGTDFVNAMKRFDDLQTIDVLANLSNLTSSGYAKGYLFSENSKLLSVINAVVASSGKKEYNNVFDAMIAPRELKGENAGGIEDFWSQNLGTFSWNASLSTWEYTEGGDKIIFKFPSTETSTVNNAVLTVSNYDGVTISNPADEDYSGELPVSLNADLKVGTTTLMSYIFSATYNTDGVPTAVASDLTLEGFKFEVDITNDSKVVSVNYKFLEDNKVILDLGAAGNGLFTEENYDANTETHLETSEYISDYVWNSTTQDWDPVYSTYTYESSSTDWEEIVNSANAHFQLYNVALRGDIDIKKLHDAIDKINEDADNNIITSDAAYYTQLTGKINEFINLRMVNVSNNEIIAKVESYVGHETVSGDYVAFRLTFGDGSPVDIETYFNQGFGTFIAELNELIQDINTNYDTDISPIEY
jgi:hypothetical protein